MVKKVRFSDKLDIFHTGISLQDHIKEVKNPIISIINGITPSPKRIMPSISDTKIETFYFDDNIWWLICIIIICILILGIWFYFKSDPTPEKENCKKTKNNIKFIIFKK